MLNVGQPYLVSWYCSRRYKLHLFKRIEKQYLKYSLSNISLNSCSSVFSMNQNPNKQKTVIIVGAGLSGLSAADYILSNLQNVKVLILQALDKVGGKCITRQIKGTKFDLGAEFIGKNQKHIIELANRAKEQFVPEDDEGTKILYLNKERSTYQSTIPSNVNILSLLQMQWCIWKIDRMSQKVDNLDPKSCEMGHYWDNITLQSWLQNNIWSIKVRLLFQASIRILLGCQLGEVSFLYFLWFVKQNGGFQNLVNIKNGLQQKKLKNGTQCLSEFLAKEVQQRGGSLKLQTKVVELIQKDNLIQVTTNKNQTFLCNYVILATGPCIYGKIHFQPSLSPQKRHLVEKSFMGKIVKLVLLYQKRFWKDKGFSGEVVSDSYDNPLLASFDDTKFNDNGQIQQPALIVFVGAEVYRYWKEKNNLKEQVARKLAQAFNCQEMTQPIAIEYYEFQEQSTIGGGPLSVLGPGTLSHIQNIRNPQGNIHFAGTQTASISIGYMDGAIESGIRASRQVLQRINLAQSQRDQQILSYQSKQTVWYNNFLRSSKKCFEWL